MTAVAFGDELGPRGRRRVLVASVVGSALLLALLVVAEQRFARNGQLEGGLWSKLFGSVALRFFAGGLANTLKAAAAAGLLAVVSGGLLAVGRTTRVTVVRLVVGAWVQLFRGIPLILLIIFLFFAPPRYGLDVSRFQALVVGLTLYNSAVIAEIVRAGILSLAKGQTEAAQAIGLTHAQTMRHVILPQALRRMVPALVSQVVILLKDTSLGVIISYEELLRRGQIAGQSLKNPLQSLLFVAAVYVVINVSLSRIARWLEHRQGRRAPAATAAPLGPAPVVGVSDALR